MRRINERNHPHGNDRQWIPTPFTISSSPMSLSPSCLLSSLPNSAKIESPKRRHHAMHHHTHPMVLSFVPLMSSKGGVTEHYVKDLPFSSSRNSMQSDITTCRVTVDKVVNGNGLPGEWEQNRVGFWLSRPLFYFRLLRDGRRSDKFCYFPVQLLFLMFASQYLSSFESFLQSYVFFKRVNEASYPFLKKCEKK